MIAEADGIGAPNPNRGMPGQLQGEVGVLDFERDVVDQAPVVEGIEGDSDDEDIEVGTLNQFRAFLLRFMHILHNSHYQ